MWNEENCESYDKFLNSRLTIIPNPEFIDLRIVIESDKIYLKITKSKKVIIRYYDYRRDTGNKVWRKRVLPLCYIKSIMIDSF